MILSNTDQQNIIAIAKKAGTEIMNFYGQDVTVKIKDDDQDSPLTLADQAASKLIGLELAKLWPNIPIVDEEQTSLNNEKALSSKLRWMVDPLDGTKEFINQNGEFTVNIALLQDDVPVFGVVYAPALDKLYFGGPAYGAFVCLDDDAPISINVSARQDDSINIVVSRSHLDLKTQAFIDLYPLHTLVKSGSSLKICLVAEGKAHVYPRFSPLNQWDIAAGDAVLRGANGAIFDPSTDTPIKYGPELLKPQSISKSLES